MENSREGVPDHAGNTKAPKRVVMAMDGGRNSMVASYLLKKQGHDVLGVAVAFARKEQKGLHFPAQLVRYNITEIEKIKHLCDAQEIPFYIVDAEDIYDYRIGEFSVSSNLSCRVFAHDIFATNLLIDILLEKSKKLGGDLVATGHRAKVFYNTKHRGFAVSSYDDEKYDQSLLLCRLSQDHLSKLLLPLSQMGEEGMAKIGNSMGGNFVERVEIMEDVKRKRLHHYMETFVPKSLIKESLVINYMTDDVEGEHSGWGLYPGQTELTLTNGQTLDSNLVVLNYCVLKEKIFVCPKNELFYTHILVESVEMIPNLNIAGPLQFYVKSSILMPTLCQLILKNNGVAVVEFGKKIQGLVYPGEQLAFYNKRGGGASMVASATATYSFHKESGKVLRFPAKEEEKES